MSRSNICWAAVQLAIGLVFALAATTASASCIDSTGTPWAGIGLSKPAGLEACVERRLRLLAAIPNAEQQAASDANGYIGGNHTGPGLAVGVVLDDGLYYSNGVGYADLAKKTRPDETTLFETGSLTKVITGSALLTLIDRPNSNIALDDDVVANWMPSLANACPPASCKITPRNLVSHTSGLPDSLQGVNMPEAQFLMALPSVALAFKPGDWSAYSGVGTAVAGLIIKHDSAEQSYDHYVINHLFVPLGMTHSGFNPSQIDVSKLAVKYDQNCSSSNCTAWSFASNTTVDPNADTSVLVPTAAYYTSIWDLARFMQMWLVLKAPNDIIKPATLQIGSASLITPPASPVQTPICAAAVPIAQNTGGGYTDSNGNFYRSCQGAGTYGANWVLSTNPKTKTLWHNGGLPEWASNTFLDLDHGMGFTVLLSTICPPTTTCAIYPVTSDFSNPILAQDGQTTWSGSVLAAGTARLLWLSGASPPPGVSGPVKMPGPVPTVHSNPNTVAKPPAGFVVVGQWMMEPIARQKYQLALLAQFSQSFQAQNGLVDVTVEPFLSKLFGASKQCSNFRVRGAPNSSTVILRLKCQQQAFDATVQVDSSGLITAITNAGPASGPY